MSDSRDFNLRKHGEDRVRAATRRIATGLRKVAEDIERIADREDLRAIPDDVAHTVSWGLANADLGGPARQLRELLILEETILKQEKEETS